MLCCELGSLSTYVRNNPEIVNQATDIWAENNRLSKEIKKLELCECCANSKDNAAL